MVQVQIHDFGLISFQTHQEFKVFSSRKGVKIVTFPKKSKIFMNIADIIILRLEMESLCPGRHFFDHKTFFFHLKTAKMPKKPPQKMTEYSETLEISTKKKFGNFLCFFKSLKKNSIKFKKSILKFFQIQKVSWSKMSYGTQAFYF